MSQDAFEYDVALSFASQDRSDADEFFRLLQEKDMSVFLDEYRPGDPWDKDVLDHLVNLYSRKARYCVLLISRHYPLKSWTADERNAARERSFRDPDEYILPVRLDDSEVPGMREEAGARDLRQDTAKGLTHLLEEKTRQAKLQVGPPSKSHDLRSGNVPTTRKDT